MNHIPLEQMRVLAIAPSTRGFGFAIMEGPEILVDWAVKSVTGDKNADSLAKLDEMISHYEPQVIVLEATAKPSVRSTRIRALSRRIITLARKRGVDISILSRQEVRQVFFADGQGTKHALAEILAKRFPEELGSRLPRKRRPWMSEDYRMDIFDAVALSVAFRNMKVTTAHDSIRH